MQDALGLCFVPLFDPAASGCRPAAGVLQRPGIWNQESLQHHPDEPHQHGLKQYCSLFCLYAVANTHICRVKIMYFESQGKFDLRSSMLKNVLCLLCVADCSSLRRHSDPGSQRQRPVGDPETHGSCQRVRHHFHFECTVLICTSVQQ